VVVGAGLDVRDGNMRRRHAPSQTGTLDNPLITEGGRAFLADLLVKLTDAQLHDLFEVSLSAPLDADGGLARYEHPGAVGQAFKKKRAEIVSRTCPF
jgi:hypothetical protein